MDTALLPPGRDCMMFGQLREVALLQACMEWEQRQVHWALARMGSPWERKAPAWKGVPAWPTAPGRADAGQRDAHARSRWAPTGWSSADGIA